MSILASEGVRATGHVAYVAVDGIDRSLIAWHLGKVAIPARLHARDPTVEDPPTPIVTRTVAHDIFPERLCHHLARARQGRVAPPI